MLKKNKKSNSKSKFGNTNTVRVTLRGKIPLLNWRQGKGSGSDRGNVEYHYNLCGCSSACGSFTAGSQLAPESVGKNAAYLEFYGNGNCPECCCGWFGAENEAWCVVPPDFLTHDFGQATNTYTEEVIAKLNIRPANGTKVLSKLQLLIMNVMLI